MPLVTRRNFLIGASSLAAFNLKEAVSQQACPPPRLTLAAGGASSTACLSGEVPSYMENMRPFDLRSLTGQFAPSSGNETMREVTPDDWLSDFRGVVVAYSGGIGDSETGALYIYGGGHGDSYNNGLYMYDFRGD